ncbi:hypothetical protein AAF712_002876 [Marasmius tenuissimus]|uniref:MYND-type domain-containing protein n=1 Tax=Marasmius tenuissimus TaxID=585030 RepID=A0ABR3A9F3_9AGAR
MSDHTRRTVAVTAIARLRQLGRPGPLQHVDINQPSRDIQVALTYLGALAEQSCGPGSSRTRIQIRANWSSLLERWVKFFLERFIVVIEEPTTSDGVDTLNCALTCIPELILSLELGNNPAPHLENLVVQAWLKVVDKNHPSWGPWSLVLVGIVMDRPTTTTLIPVATSPVLYQLEGDPALGLILIRKLDILVEYLPTMDPLHLSYFHAFFTLIINTDQCFRNGRPILLECNRPELLIRSLLRVLRTVFYKRKLAPGLEPGDLDRNDPEHIVHFVACVSLSLLRNVEHNPLDVLEVLEYGIIDIMSKVPPLYFLLDSESRSLSTCFVAVLEVISRFLVYETIMRRFIRKTQKIRSSEDLEQRLRSVSEPVWGAWVRVKDKALVLYDVYRGMKRSKGLCSFPQASVCPNTSPPVIDGVVDHSEGRRYFRCAGCAGAMYCSPACQKMDWQFKHRQECPRKPSPDVLTLLHDFQFIREWMKSYIQDNGPLVSRDVDDFVSSIGELPAGYDMADRSLIKENRKNPIIFVNLDVKDLPSSDSIKIVDPEWVNRSQSTYHWRPESVETFLRYWRDPQEDMSTIFLLLSFPRESPQAMIIWGQMDFPLKETEAEVGSAVEERETYNFFEGEEDVLD